VVPTEETEIAELLKEIDFYQVRRFHRILGAAKSLYHHSPYVKVGELALPGTKEGSHINSGRHDVALSMDLLCAA
jgi:hypothetical protein